MISWSLVEFVVGKPDFSMTPKVAIFFYKVQLAPTKKN